MMTNPPDTVPTSAPAEPAGGDRSDPQTWMTPLRKPDTAEREPAQVWRSWLGEAAAENNDTDPDSEGDTESSPNPTASVLALDDDPMAPIVSEMYARRAARRHRLNQRVMIGAAVTAVAVAAAVGALVLTHGSGTDAAGVAPASPAPSLTTAAVATPVPPAWCHGVNSANLIVSDGPGDLTSGPGVILAQQFSLYARRDVTGVRAVLAPDAQAASEVATRAAIDATPPGTKHCVTIRPDGPDRWAVQVSEQRPDRSTPQWDQTVTTAKQADGRVLITSITAGGA
ncbi:hypothetical protein [Nocardia brasiliensis]|uniref:hypothetical protein n=1 Tax=Nocardia brasiliensis TaxID=37326 RepID=UPI002456276D|nr:hypothetical protein [Nocardia brasiliensis]